MGNMRGGMNESTDTPRDAGANRSASTNPFGDEYKILQDKIDKVGASRLTIKGWSVTATVGVFAVASNKYFPPIASALGLQVLLAFFFWFEREQVRHSWKYIARAGNIEFQIDRFRRATGERVSFSSPSIVRSHFRDKKLRDSEHFKFKNRTLEKVRIRTSKEFHLARGADFAFYFVLFLSAFSLLFVHFPSQTQTTPTVIQNNIQLPKEVTTGRDSGPNGSNLPSRINAPKGVKR
jgi:hypothetical protein